MKSDRPESTKSTVLETNSKQKNWHRFENKEEIKLAKNAAGREVGLVKEGTKNKPELIEFGDVKVGLYETQGGDKARNIQPEDALITFLPPNELHDLPEEEQKQVFKQTVQVCHERYGQSRQGSTLNGTIAWREGNTIHTSTANLGDSLSFLVILNKNGTLKDAIHLNEMHNITNEAEIDRVLKDRGRIDEVTNRVLSKDSLGSIALTRSIGDKDYPGLSRIPTVEFKTHELKEGEQAFLVVTCDAVTDKDEHGYLAASSSTIGRIVTRYANHPDQAAKAISDKTEEISPDNISIAVVPITSAVPVAAFVFDGHGGKDVSDALGNFFYYRFREMVFDIKDRLENSGY